ncbi:hypothetical protein SDJN02_14576, partial [Cucurbita argyrosperma subsp. argyrosperma]
MNLVGPSEIHPLSPKQTSPFPDRFTDEARPQMERRGKWGSMKIIIMVIMNHHHPRGESLKETSHLLCTCRPFFNIFIVLCINIDQHLQKNRVRIFPRLQGWARR